MRQGLTDLTGAPVTTVSLHESRARAEAADYLWDKIAEHIEDRADIVGCCFGTPNTDTAPPPSQSQMMTPLVAAPAGSRSPGGGGGYAAGMQGGSFSGGGAYSSVQGGSFGTPGVNGPGQPMGAGGPMAGTLTPAGRYEMNKDGILR